MLIPDGRLSPAPMLTGFVGLVLAANVIGGTVLFALISYAQVAQQI